MKNITVFIALFASSLNTFASGVEELPMEALRLICKGNESINDPLLSKLLGYKTRPSTVKIHFFHKGKDLYASMDGFSARLFIKKDGMLGLAAEFPMLQIAGEVHHASSLQESNEAIHRSIAFSLRLDRETGQLDIEDTEITTDKRSWKIVSSTVTGSYACEKSEGLKF